MAKEIYNKNAREAHLMSEAYQRVYNENAEDNEVEFPNSEYGRSLERDAKQHEQERADNIDYARSKRYEEGKTLTLNEEEINVVQEALLRLEPESFWREGGSKDEFYNEEEVNRMLYIAQDILTKSGVE